MQKIIYSGLLKVRAESRNIYTSGFLYLVAFIIILFPVSDGQKFLQDAEKHPAPDAVPDVCALTI